MSDRDDPDMIEVRESKVSYSTKELLARIDSRFERLEDLAHGMAARSDVEAVAARVTAIEQEQNEVRAVATALLSDKKERFTIVEKVIGLAFATLTTLAALDVGPF